MSVLGLQHHVFDLKSSYLFADLLTGRVLASHPLCRAARITLHHSHAGKPFSLRRAARITLRQSQAVSYSCSLADWPCVGKPPSLRRAARITLHHSHASRFITATHHASSQPRITLHHSHASRFITATHLETSGPRLEFKAPTMYAVWTLSIARIYTSFAKRVRPNNTDRTAKLQSLFAPDITIPCRPR
jgi:hypothetical protein